jgi:DNA/RNA endonuclease G (NUC1)
MAERKTEPSRPNELLYFNGIDAASGKYLLPPMSAEPIAQVARNEPIDPRHLKELIYWHQRTSQATLGPVQGVDPSKLEETGWGVIFHAQAQVGPLRDALRELLDLRHAQAARSNPRFYREFSGPDGYRPGESKPDFLARHGAGPGPADPTKVPYYLLIVADPESIPFRFQFQLDVQYAVGRLWFDHADGSPDLEAFARYARSVAEAGRGAVALPRQAVFFGVRNPGDWATALSADELVKPLAEGLTAQLGGSAPWQVRSLLADQATKTNLATVLGGAETPALLFTASHGVGFPRGDPRQLHYQGALLCQDWPGPDNWDGQIPPAHYFAADDVPDSARLLGLIAFHFACYGAGTPRLDDFAHSALGAGQAAIAPSAFLANLPRRLLSHPRGGALAVIGHVERAWGYSFHWERAGRQLQCFESTLRTLLGGAPVGWALEFFNQRYAELSSDLSTELEDVKFGKVADDFALAGLWTANNDARSFIIIGDPAVRLPLAGDGGARPRPELAPVQVRTGPPAEPSLTPSATPPPPPPGPPPSGPAPSVGSPIPESAAVLPARSQEGAITLTIPIQISIRVGEGGTVTVAGAGTGPSAAPAPVSSGAVPFAVSMDPEYGDREGYDPEFLGGDSLRVPLPELSTVLAADAAVVRDAQPGDSPYEVRYHHFSVVMNGKRRLAYFTAVNIDGRLHRRDQLPREKDRWVFDPRIGRAEQLGQEFYGKPFDRGQLVRRLDPAWGRTVRVAKVANDDTFHWTNCSPQHERFNERQNLWAGLEDFLLNKATGARKRLVVFTGPVFTDRDPEYQGVKVPTRFWKVAVVQRPNGRLAALGFVVTQEALVAEVAFDPLAVARTYQTSIRKVEKLTGLDFGPLRDRDAESVASFAPGTELQELQSEADVRILL